MRLNSKIGGGWLVAGGFVVIATLNSILVVLPPIEKSKMVHSECEKTDLVVETRRGWYPVYKCVDYNIEQDK